MKNYEIPLHEDQELLDNFLDTWPISRIEKMTLEEYTDVDNKYTFICEVCDFGAIYN